MRASGVRAGAEADRLTVATLDRDRGFLVVLAKRLERRGWGHQVVPARTSVSTIAAMAADVLIVDLAVLGSRRWSWLERLCREHPSLAILVCGGSSTVAERVRALRLGADDWLSKPCHPEELIARIESITSHRRRERRNIAPITAGEVEIRLDQHQAFAGGRSLELTRREFQLLQLLAGSGGGVLERERIYESLWGYEMIRNDRSVDVFVHKLRRKLERASPAWRYIHTHFRVGYRFAAELIDERAPRRLEPHREAAPERLAA